MNLKVERPQASDIRLQEERPNGIPEVWSLEPGAFLKALILLPLVVSACGNSTENPSARVAATNSYIECVVLDLLGPETPVLCLSGSGMCPGHFDIRPSQVNKLSRCRVLARVDFQASLDAKRSGVTKCGLSIASISPGDGLCVPSSYYAACEQMAEALVDAGLLDRAQADARLIELTQRNSADEAWVRSQVRRVGLAGRPVLAAKHQAHFCSWLGLDVVGTFGGSDTTRFGEIDLAVKAGRDANVKLVIANGPSGRRSADALAERLGAKVVVFGNFPVARGANAGFRALLRDNTNKLISVAHP